MYADTSFLVSLYVNDKHSADARSRVGSVQALWFSPLHRMEWSHAIAQHLFRGVMTARESDEVYDQLAKDRIAGVWREVAVPDTAYDLCAELGRVHCPKLGVRTIDSLHVACALELKADRFWTYDERQLKLAKAQGLNTAP
ncbi:MAG TPA: type II toxin-antitoxin system VapC family toxin [Candidatus Sulfotelmatobacter sp.]|nr:type II toxin-antitoxin system VapC family toxin [Candidatus Sulfotelmatobacter sp.]